MRSVPPRSKPRARFRTRACGVVVFCCVSSCGTTLGEIETELGQTTTAPMQLAAGTSVKFPVSTTWVSFDRAKSVLLRVELMKGGSVVETLDCTGYSFGRGTTTSGCGTGSTQTFELCRAVIPSGGVDALRVSTRLDSGTAKIRGLKVLVKQR